jgi:hypothetical protein
VAGGAGPVAAAKAARTAYKKQTRKQQRAAVKRHGRWSLAGIGLRLTGRISRGVRIAGVTARVAVQVALAKTIGRIKEAVAARLRKAGKRLGNWVINTLADHRQLVQSKAGWLLLVSAFAAWPIARLLTGRPLRQTITPADVHPPIADSVDDPGHATQEGPSVMPNPVLGQALLAKAQEMLALTASYDPEGMLTWGADMKLWGEALGVIAQVAQALSQGADELPVHPAVRSAMASVIAVQTSTARAQEQVVDSFERVHQVQLDNLRNPQQGAEKWDVRVNKE